MGVDETEEVLPPIVVGDGDDMRVVGVDGEPVIAMEDVDDEEDEGIIDEVTVAGEEIELVSPQIDMMLLLSVLMYPVNFVSISSK